MQRINSFRYQAQAKLGKSLIALIELWMYPFLPKASVFSSSDFAWTRTIEDEWQFILKEFETISKRSNALFDICDISPEQYAVVERGNWDIFPLYTYGLPYLPNLEACPRTAALLETIPDKTTAFFSILKPGSHIKPHRGSFRGYLKFHLGLSIPEPDKCGIKVGEETLYWNNGESIVFDDTVVHEAWNNGSENRTILYVDFIRPLPFFLKLISWGLTNLIARSPFIADGLERAAKKQK